MASDVTGQFGSSSTQDTKVIKMIPVFIFLLLAPKAEAEVGDSSKLDFCSETEQCLLFDRICQNAEYEVRHYESVKWISTNETCYFMEIAALKAFRRLYEYTEGANEEGKKIGLAAPGVMRIPDKWFWQSGEYRISFLLPAEYQDNPPKPTDKELYIYETSDVKVYVRTFSGWLSSWSDRREAKSLSSALDSAGAKYKKGGHDAAEYNCMLTFFNRHNEIWFEAIGEPVC